ncbi:putative 2'-deoxynucleoside 5'-phosphate N-hydrolase 1 isoform X2 [Penaeus japonicus]|uniref:putative 2'-deoxynucleoside 5'-phosphate N-hydrolase 1 isoform X2 n=1 Tax=Penaeus japonicus TaxID=27405 RepID=UPI001C7167FE|nr:putative 2'-deoxynucleoside 5'-phosphate N-hydrolase 1 isoform X2 [Penaeus japonicus]
MGNVQGQETGSSSSSLVDASSEIINSYSSDPIIPHSFKEIVTMATGVKIYFCGSIRAGRGDVAIYGRIVEMLGKYGTVLTPFVADPKLTEMALEEGKARTDKEIYDQDVSLLEECQAIVAEVTQPSLGVGFELGCGVAMKKKILCLYRPQPEKRLSAMIRGAEKEGSFMTRDYKEEDLPAIFEDFFQKVVPRDRKDSLDWKSYEPM